MLRRMAVVVLLAMSTGLGYAAIGDWEGCGGRLERALDALRRDSTRRNSLDDEDPEAGIIYQQVLRSAPLEMSVSRITVKIPQDRRVRGSPWAQVERCVYEPGNNSLQTRLLFNDLSVSGLVSLLPRDYRAPLPAESCRMTLRLRRAGIDFFTSPIARGRGQMRIRTESSFLEPRFASIYAFGCRPTRLDKQIKRQDKWPPQQNSAQVSNQQTVVLPTISLENYEAAEPRELVSASREEDVGIANESRRTRALYGSEARLGIWRKNDWITRLPRRRRSVQDITPSDFAMALAKKARSLLMDDDKTSHVNDDSSSDSIHRSNMTESQLNENSVETNIFENAESKANYKREMTEAPDPVEIRELLLTGDPEVIDLDVLEVENRGWQSREGVAREMEDVFLRGASQALTSYIERQLHPAIKETLMLSMGYTISYG